MTPSTHLASSDVLCFEINELKEMLSTVLITCSKLYWKKLHNNFTGAGYNSQFSYIPYDPYWEDEVETKGLHLFSQKINSFCLKLNT